MLDLATFVAVAALIEYVPMIRPEIVLAGFLIFRTRHVNP